MPILWRRLAWFASFGIALILIAWMRSQGFGWLPSLCAAAVVYVVSPFVISQFCAAFVLSRLHANSTRSPGTELQRILPAYVALQTAYSDCVIDASWLPVEKKQMVEIFKLSWLRAPTDETRNWIETGWAFLPFFQDGVGNTPISLRIPKNTPVDEYVELSKTRDRWLELVLAESEILARERDCFKKANSS